jgi:hypothetical protein
LGAEPLAPSGAERPLQRSRDGPAHDQLGSKAAAVCRVPASVSANVRRYTCRTILDKSSDDPYQIGAWNTRRPQIDAPLSRSVPRDHPASPGCRWSGLDAVGRFLTTNAAGLDPGAPDRRDSQKLGAAAFAYAHRLITTAKVVRLLSPDHRSVNAQIATFGRPDHLCFLG